VAGVSYFVSDRRRLARYNGEIKGGRVSAWTFRFREGDDLHRIVTTGSRRDNGALLSSEFPCSDAARPSKGRGVNLSAPVPYEGAYESGDGTPSQPVEVPFRTSAAPTGVVEGSLASCLRACRAGIHSGSDRREAEGLDDIFRDLKSPVWSRLFMTAYKSAPAPLLARLVRSRINGKSNSHFTC
jgi:hypothetical protein